MDSSNLRKYFPLLVLLCLFCFRIQAEETKPPQISPWHPFNSREEAEKFLSTADIVKSKWLGVGVANPRKLTLDNGKVQHYAVFKSIDERKFGVTQLERTTEYDFKDSWKFEVAAYELDKLIGLNMVPVTVERTYKTEKGSLQWWVDNAMTETDRVKNKLEPSDLREWRKQLARMRLFDSLVYNIDRNQQNLLVTPDWKLWLIDHSRTFKNVTTIKSAQDLTYFPRSVMEALRKLDEATVTAHCGEWLRPPEIQCMLKRRDMIIQRYDQLLAEKGDSITFP